MGREAGDGALIEAALAHAKFLRESANMGDDYDARAAEAEAERWEWRLIKTLARKRLPFRGYGAGGARLGSPTGGGVD
jgi:hypothetical protein